MTFQFENIVFAIKMCHIYQNHYQQTNHPAKQIIYERTGCWLALVGSILLQRSTVLAHKTEIWWNISM